MKKCLTIAGGLFLLVVLAATGLLIAGMNTGRIVQHAVNTYGPGIVKTELRLGDVDVRFVAGRLQLKDLFVGNPPGFSSPKLLSAGLISVQVDRSSLLADPVVIARLDIEGPDICFEKKPATDNFKALLKNMDSGPAASQRSSAGERRAASGAAGSRTYVIRDLYIRNAKITASFTALGTRHISLTIPELHLNDIGRSGGARPEQIARQVLAGLYEKVLAAAGPAGVLLETSGDSAQWGGRAVKKGFKSAAEGLKNLLR